MSKIELEPLEEGDNVVIPLTKTTIGRGPFLQVADKRVSRNHATLEVDINGDLVLTPIHTNPCFLKEPGSEEQSTLPKDKAQVLEHGDIFGLLPDKLFYKVIYLDKSKQKAKKEDVEESDATDDEKPSVNGDGDSKKVKPVKLQKKGKEMAMPLSKERPLPDWMVGAAYRQGGTTKATPKKAPPKPKPKPKAPPATPNKDRPKASTKKVKEPSEDEVEEEEEEESEEETKKPARGRSQRAARRKKAPSDDDYFDSDEDDGKSRPRLGRQASKNKRYSDDFVLSDEEVMGESESEEEKKKDSDGSDFNAEDIDSGSDLEEEVVVRERSSGRRGSGGGRRGRRRRDSDSFSEDDFRDSYKPRLSKRRAASKKRYRDDSEEEDSDEDFSEEEIIPKRKKVAKKTPKRTPARKRRKQESEDEVSEEEEEMEEEEEKEESPKKRGGRKVASDKKNQDDSEEESAEENNGKNKGKKKKESEDEDEKESEDDTKAKKNDGPRRPCMFGDKCYRKNPVHFKEFCHPGDSSFDEDEAQERRVNPKPRRKMRESDQKSILRGDGDDDGDANTYDYGDSFLNDDDGSEESETFDPAEEDSDYEPGEEDDVNQLKKEAKSFVRNKKLVKPAKSK